MRLFSIIVLSFIAINIYAYDIQYPKGNITENQPVFIFRNRYFSRDKQYKVSYRLTIYKSDKLLYTVDFYPKIYRDVYGYTTIQQSLAIGTYKYKIERFQNGFSEDYQYSTYQRFPIINTFSIIGNDNFYKYKNPEDLIDYLLLKHLKSRYWKNALYYFIGGILSVAIGFALIQIPTTNFLFSLLHYYGYVGFAAGSVAIIMPPYYIYKAYSISRRDL